MRFTLLLLLPALLLWNCQSSKNSKNGQNDTAMQACETDMRQGILIKVIWKEGNFMPSPDGNKAPTGQPVVREIYVHALTTQSATTQTEIPFYERINTKLQAKATSNAQGCVVFALPEGTYSIFSKEPKGFWANMFDGQGHIFPVEVKKDALTEVQFVIDYEAAY